jgi:hypothetical protein
VQSRDDALGAGRGEKEGEMAEKNKNQTAQERARLRELIGSQASNRFCAAGSCPTKGQPILKKDLYPIVMAYPRRTVYYHRACTTTF